MEASRKSMRNRQQQKVNEMETDREKEDKSEEEKPKIQKKRGINKEKKQKRDKPAQQDNQIVEDQKSDSDIDAMEEIEIFNFLQRQEVDVRLLITQLQKCYSANKNVFIKNVLVFILKAMGLSSQQCVPISSSQNIGEFDAGVFLKTLQQQSPEMNQNSVPLSACTKEYVFFRAHFIQFWELFINSCEEITLDDDVYGFLIDILGVLVQSNLNMIRNNAVDVATCIITPIIQQCNIYRQQVIVAKNEEQKELHKKFNLLMTHIQNVSKNVYADRFNDVQAALRQKILKQTSLFIQAHPWLIYFSNEHFLGNLAQRLVDPDQECVLAALQITQNILALLDAQQDTDAVIAAFKDARGQLVAIVQQNLVLQSYNQTEQRIAIQAIKCLHLIMKKADNKLKDDWVMAVYRLAGSTNKEVASQVLDLILDVKFKGNYAKGGNVSKQGGDGDNQLSQQNIVDLLSLLNMVQRDLSGQNQYIDNVVAGLMPKCAFIYDLDAYLELMLQRDGVNSFSQLGEIRLDPQLKLLIAKMAFAVLRYVNQHAHATAKVEGANMFKALKVSFSNSLVLFCAKFLPPAQIQNNCSLSAPVQDVLMQMLPCMDFGSLTDPDQQNYIDILGAHFSNLLIGSASLQQAQCIAAFSAACLQQSSSNNESIANIMQKHVQKMINTTLRTFFFVGTEFYNNRGRFFVDESEELTAEEQNLLQQMKCILGKLSVLQEQLTLRLFIDKYDVLLKSVSNILLDLLPIVIKIHLTSQGRVIDLTCVEFLLSILQQSHSQAINYLPDESVRESINDRRVTYMKVRDMIMDKLAVPLHTKDNSQSGKDFFSIYGIAQNSVEPQCFVQFQLSSYQLLLKLITDIAALPKQATAFALTVTPHLQKDFLLYLHNVQQLLFSNSLIPSAASLYGEVCQALFKMLTGTFCSIVHIDYEFILQVLQKVLLNLDIASTVAQQEHYQNDELEKGKGYAINYLKFLLQQEFESSNIDKLVLFRLLNQYLLSVHRLQDVTNAEKDDNALIVDAVVTVKQVNQCIEFAKIVFKMACLGVVGGGNAKNDKVLRKKIQMFLAYSIQQALPNKQYYVFKVLPYLILESTFEKEDFNRLAAFMSCTMVQCKTNTNPMNMNKSNFQDVSAFMELLKKYSGVQEQQQYYGDGIGQNQKVQNQLLSVELANKDDEFEDEKGNKPKRMVRKIIGRKTPSKEAYENACGQVQREIEIQQKKTEQKEEQANEGCNDIKHKRQGQRNQAQPKQKGQRR